MGRTRLTLLTAIVLGAIAGLAFGQTIPPGDKPAAVVNGEIISQTEFANIWSKVPSATAPLPEAQRKLAQMQLLQMLIDEMLLQQFLRKNVPSPDPLLVQQRINDLDNALKAKGKTLQQYYLDTGQSESRIKTDIAAVVQWNAYTKKHITEDQVKKYYEENRELFDGVMIRASHIFLKVAKDAEPSAQQAARQKLQAVRQEIAKGLDFAEAAKKHGQDAAAANGGDLGYFPSARNDADPFLRTVSVMKAGQVSDVVQTDYGFHLIKVTDRKSGKPSSFEECQEDARILVAEELRLSIIDQERKKAKIEISLP